MGSLLLMGAGGKGGAAAGGDPSFASTLLLLGLDGVDGATTFNDESAAARGAATFNGNAQLDTAQAKFGTASLLLDGTGDSITYADSADWNFAGEFTIEGWMRIPAGLANGTYSIISIYQGAGTRSFRLFWTRGTSTRTMQFAFSTDGSTVAHSLVSGDVDATLVDDAFLHWAVDRDGSGTMRLYLEGTMIASKVSATGTNFNSAEALNIGGASSGQLAFNGWLDEIRITGGVGRYASDGGYVVPTAAFPRV